jgi:anti-anti-sigma factor
MTPPDVPVLIPPTDLTEATLAPFEAKLMAMLDVKGPGVVLDLDLVEFIGSAGLGTLVKAGMRLGAQGRGIAFARAQKATEQTITLLGLHEKMPIFETVEEACAHVARGGKPSSWG